MKTLKPEPYQEFRYVDPPELLVETRDENKITVVQGTAVKFGQLSRNLGWFREKFDRNAFDNVMEDDVVALFNHNIDKVLARTISKTLEIWTDEEGLKYRFDAPDNTAGRDLIVSLGRGDIRHSSFSFSISDEKWEQDDDDGEIRTVLKVKRLYDVSPVVFAAYPQSVSEISKRSYDEWKDELNRPAKEARAIELETELLEQELQLQKLIL